jgi:hypothetical protein
MCRRRTVRPSVFAANLALAIRYSLRVWPNCTIQLSPDIRSYFQSLGCVMGLDAGTVLKRPILCSHCNEEYYFTLRAISDHPELRCHGCGGSICLRDSVYEPLLSDVRAVLEAIHSTQSAASFISARPAVGV